MSGTTARRRPVDRERAGALTARRRPHAVPPWQGRGPLGRATGGRTRPRPADLLGSTSVRSPARRRSTCTVRQARVGRNQMETDPPHDRLAALEERVRQLEDHVAVYRLICSWGAGADIGSGERGGGAVDRRRRAGVRGDEGRGAVRHFGDDRQRPSAVVGPARVRARAGSSRGEGGGRSRHRHQLLPGVLAHRRRLRHLARDGQQRGSSAGQRDGWRAARRTSHVIDGSPKARELLGSAFGESA